MRKTSKIKRIFAGLLALLLTVALLPAQTARIAKADPTIDPDPAKKGSLTIHKYEYNGTGGTAGTGEGTDLPPSDPSHPDDPQYTAIPLDGVKFKVTYVAKLDDYYGTDGNPLIALADAQNIASGSTTDVTGGVFSKNVGEYMTATTTSGVATLSNLPLGLYLVQEVEAPAQITGKAADFLVSIPMTNVAGNDWLYDVHVFPKNSSTYASVTLKKMGQVGNGTAAELENAYFVLESSSDSGVNWSKVTTNNKGISIGQTVNGENNVLTTNADGKISVSDLAPGLYCFREIGAPDGYIADTVTRHRFRIKDNGNVYLIDDAGIEAGTPTDTSTNPITITNYKPVIDKQVQKSDGTTWVGDKTVDNNNGVVDYSIGDTVPFRIVIDVPANVEDLKLFKVTDTMSAGLINATDFSVKGYTNADMSDTPVSISVTEQISDPTWTIDFSGVTGISAYKKIVIEFKATVDTDAVIANNGNPNDVTLEYSNKITEDQDITEPPKSTLTDEVVVYSFKIDLTKDFTGAVFGNSETYSATFQLYRENTTNGADTLKFSDGSTVKADKVGSPITIVKDSATAATDSFSGLANGTYYIVETSTESGYNLLKEPKKVVLEVEYTTTITTKKTTNADGSITESIETRTTAYSNNAATDTTITFSNGTYSTTITNSKGFTLPTTGGVGSVIFVFVGVSMMIAAVIMFWQAIKKKDNKKASK